MGRTVYVQLPTAGNETTEELLTRIVKENQDVTGDLTINFLLPKLTYEGYKTILSAKDAEMILDYDYVEGFDPETGQAVWKNAQSLLSPLEGRESDEDGQST